MTKMHDIIWFDELDSTNDEAARHIHDLDNLSVLSAGSQISGRGQRSNVWMSEPGKNLTFSVVLKYGEPGHFRSDRLPSVMARDQKLISDIVSSSVLEFLSTYGINAEIKFPNDILVDGRKICGILIEHSVRGLYLVHSIVGIGLNINQRNFDATLPNPTSMALIMDERKDPAPVEPDLNSCLEEFMNIFIRALQQRLQLDSQI